MEYTTVLPFLKQNLIKKNNKEREFRAHVFIFLFLDPSRWKMKKILFHSVLWAFSSKEAVNHFLLFATKKSETIKLLCSC